MLAYLFPLYSFFFTPWFLEHVERVRLGAVIPAFGIICAMIVVLAVAARWLAPGPEPADDDLVGSAVLS